MITVRVCDQVAHKPFDRFNQKDSTTTYVRVPRALLPTAQLMVFAEHHGFHACIEVDGEELLCVPLEGPRTAIDLPEPPKHNVGAFLRPLTFFARGSGHSQPQTNTFTVLIRRGSNEGQVVGTYVFQLLDEVTFAATLESHLQEAREKRTAPPVVYTTDHHQPGSLRTCWNCNTPIQGECCSNCGCCQEEPQNS